MNKSIKRNLKDLNHCIGSWVTMKDPDVSQILCESNSIDWLAIDMEHTGLSIEAVSSHIQVINLLGKSPLVRLPNLDQVLIKKVMDLGAHGLIVPMVTTLSQVLDAYKYMHYPPLGNRGVGLSRAQHFGKMGAFEEYKSWLKNESILIAQIEHIDAIREIDLITSCKYLDGILIGMYDLSASLGLPGDFNSKQFVECIETIKKSAIKNKMSLGIHLVEPDYEQFQKLLSENFNLIAYSTDFRMIESSISILDRIY